MDNNSEQMIEQLRAEMIQLYERVGSFTDSRVVEISQQLDTFLVEVQRKRKCQTLVE